MVEIKNISVSYGKNKVLDALSLHIERGKLIAVIGTNGAGKSTLLKAVAGVVPTMGGEILVEGKPKEEMNRREISQKITYLAQGKNTPDMTVFQMVIHGRFPYLSYPRRYGKNDREKAEESLRKTGLTNYANTPLASLSGGMRQNAYIAMALTQDTECILLDEPTTYLDIAAQTQLMKLLKSLTENRKAIVTVMHDLPLAFHFSDMIAVMDGGRIVMFDTPCKVSESDIIESIFGVGLEYCPEGNYYRYKYNSV